MKFTLVDRIIDCNTKDSIKTVKNLALGEEYLADHFPGYPVMPGVLMFEAMVQSASWLIRILTNFSISMVTVSEVSNLKYGKFVVPGDTLELTVTLKSKSDNLASFRGKGTVNGKAVVSGQFAVSYFKLSDTDTSLAPNDAKLIASALRAFATIGGTRFYTPPIMN